MSLEEYTVQKSIKGFYLREILLNIHLEEIYKHF
jgi:hypothetical protein